MLNSLHLFVCFCCFTSHVNSYGHCGTFSKLTFKQFFQEHYQSVFSKKLILKNASDDKKTLKNISNAHAFVTRRLNGQRQKIVTVYPRRQYILDILSEIV